MSTGRVSGDGTAAAARILYIDDDPGLGRLVRRALEARGYAVEICPDGAAGLARLAQGGIDAVALDHHMPGQTGLDLLPEIRALPEAPPVIYVTGSEDSRVAVAALKAGAVDYVWKDVQGQFRELLGEAVATALRQESLRRDKERAEAEVREARDRAELLLREVNHRVANSLALVAALAHMQRNAVTDSAAKAALDEMQARISAIAGIHRRLYTSDDVESVELDAYLQSLVEELQAAMRASGRDHAIRLRAAPVRLSTDKAVSVGVVEGTPMLDLCYTEDSAAGTDMNVVAFEDGRLVEVQGTAEHGAYSRAELDRMLDLALGGIGQLCGFQKQALGGLLP